jgi:DNA-binding SARP family transcriptional activator
MCMIPALSIRVFGSFEVRANPREDPIIMRRKTRAALAYLVAGAQPHSRQALVDLFCQNANNPPAALRSLLSRIRRRLGNDALLTTGDAVRFNPHAGAVDCVDFATALDGDLDSLPTRALAAALDLYRGEFLENVQLDDSPQFELWLLNERARYRRLYERGLATLVRRLSEQGDLSTAIERALALVRSNPLREEPHATLMRLYARNGQKQAALEQYDYCRQVLERELAVPPAPELTMLRDEIAAGRPESPRSQPARPRPRPRPGAGDLVGRATEMARLQEAWQAIRPGRVSVVLIDAEAGVCYESTATLAYAPWLDLLEMWLARLGDGDLKRLSPYAREHLSRLLPALARRLGRRRPPLPAAAPGERLRLFAAVSELLLEWPDGPPLLLFIDDLHWADEASLQLFHFLARRSSPGRCLLAGAWRSEEAPATSPLQSLLDDLQKTSPLQLTLAPLAPAAVTELTGRLWPELPAGYRPHVAGMLARATGGNPLFISEILRELAGSGDVPAALPVPHSVAGLVRRRLNRLPQSGRQVVEAMAVLDAPATPDQAQQISGRSEEETAGAIDGALQRGILRARAEDGAGRYDFAHDLMRSAVLGQLSPVRRALLHRRAATTLEAAGAPAATLAHHWKMAGDARKEAHYARLAGEQAAAIYANEEAGRYLQRALALAEDVETRLSIMGRLGDVWVLTGAWQKAEELFNQALQLAKDREDRQQQARFQGALGKLLSRRGLYAEALCRLQKARDDARAAGDRSAEASYVGTMGIVYWQQDDYERALACYRQALQVERELGNERGVAVWTGNVASI